MAPLAALSLPVRIDKIAWQQKLDNVLRPWRPVSFQLAAPLSQPAAVLRSGACVCGQVSIHDCARNTLFSDVHPFWIKLKEQDVK